MEMGIVNHSSVKLFQRNDFQGRYQGTGRIRTEKRKQQTFRKLPSDSPAIFDIISGPLIKKKNAPVSFATALAIRVFPQPGGPYNKIPDTQKNRSHSRCLSKVVATQTTAQKLTVAF